MTVLEVGHPMWSRSDADRVAWALLDQAACTGVRLVPPAGPCDGWGVVATYAEDPEPALASAGELGPICTSDRRTP